MSISSRVQLFLGVGAAFAAYILLLVDSGGHIGLKTFGLGERKPPEVSAAKRP